MERAVLIVLHSVRVRIVLYSLPAAPRRTAMIDATLWRVIICVGARAGGK